jgi:hypothetical protein
MIAHAERMGPVRRPKTRDAAQGRTSSPVAASGVRIDGLQAMCLCIRGKC